MTTTTNTTTAEAKEALTALAVNNFAALLDLAESVALGNTDLDTLQPIARTLCDKVNIEQLDLSLAAAGVDMRPAIERLHRMVSAAKARIPQ